MIMIAGGMEVIGGVRHIIDNVYAYNIEDNVYKAMAPLPYVLKESPLVLKGNIIYAFGGRTKDEEITNKVLAMSIEGNFNNAEFEIYNDTLDSPIFQHFVIPYN